MTFESVHPRLRGELAMRIHGNRLNYRFIPAYAGNSLASVHTQSALAVHPRLRGELMATWPT